MDHRAAYNRLMQRAYIRPRPIDQPTELHHCVPRSKGGGDDKRNLVYLTVREHLTAHILLAHMPGFESQWFSVQAILDDAINPNRPLRFMQPKLRYKGWIRKRIAYQRAIELRSRAKKKNKQLFGSRDDFINAAYFDTMFDLAGMGPADK